MNFWVFSCFCGSAWLCQESHYAIPTEWGVWVSDEPNGRRTSCSEIIGTKGFLFRESFGTTRTGEQKAFFSGNPSEQLVRAKTNRRIIDLSYQVQRGKRCPTSSAGRFVAEWCRYVFQNYKFFLSNIQSQHSSTVSYVFSPCIFKVSFRIKAVFV